MHKHSFAMLALLVFAGPPAIAAEQTAAEPMGAEPTAADVDYLERTDFAEGKDRLDVYMPANAQRVPVVVYFHGGGLMYGDKSMAREVAQRLLPHGIGLVAANYRLSPGVQHPAHVQDAAAATLWTLRHIQQFGGDPGNVFVSGHSAGAYLAALLALDPAYLGGKGLPAIRGAAPVSAFLYVEETARERPKTVWGEDPQDWLAASVTPHIGPGKPPLLLIYADGDDPWRREQNQRLSAALTAAGNPQVEARQVPDRDHVTLISRILDEDDQVASSIATFVASHRR